MMLRKRRLTLDCQLEEVTGSGSQLTFKVRGYRNTKAGTHEDYALELKTCRYAVRLLLAEIRKMHVRDRQRIQAELVRIQNEIAELTVDLPGP